MSDDLEVIVCTNDEWLVGGVIDLGSCWGKEVARERFAATVDYLESHNIRYKPASGALATFHGWNGAKFAWRCGALACWDKPTPEQERTLIDADDAGLWAAEVFYRELP